MFKGILSTIYIDLNSGSSLKNIQRSLKKFHQNNRFVKILKNNSMISTNDVINTNNCIISVCETRYKNKIVILSAIDNLIKGGAGQAVQNMNLKFDFNELAKFHGADEKGIKEKLLDENGHIKMDFLEELIEVYVDAHIKNKFGNYYFSPNIIYAQSWWTQRELCDCLNYSLKHKIPIVFNQNGWFYPAWYKNNWKKRNETIVQLHKISNKVIYQSAFCKTTSVLLTLKSSKPSKNLFCTHLLTKIILSTLL